MANLENGGPTDDQDGDTDLLRVLSQTMVATADECAVYALTCGGSETDVVNTVTATADGGFAVTG